jgi:hypothetical protein
MNRRQFLATGTALASAAPVFAAGAKPSIIELSFIRMRNTQDAMVQRTNDYLAKSYVPALRRAGAKNVGAFTYVIGEGNPSTVLAIEYADASSWESSGQRLRDDKDLLKGADAFYAGPLQYVRRETVILRGFPSMPNVEVPSARSESKTHIFELRTYESNNQRSLARKIRMFDEGEIAIFRKVGMTPVFFGEALAGGNLPQLTYLLAYDDMAARDKSWAAFGSHPDWMKMKNEPGASDGEIVSNISNAILRPLPFSSIR